MPSSPRGRRERLAQLVLAAGEVAEEAERDPERGPGRRRLGVVVAGGGGRGQRLLAALARLRPAPQAHQRVPLRGEQPRAQRCRVVRQQPQRGRVALERRRVVPRVVLAEPLVQPRGALGIGGVVVRRERRPPERERARLGAAVAGRLGRAREQLDAVAALRGDDVPQRERALVVRARLGERVRAGGLRSRLERGGQRVGVRAGALPLVGEPRRRRSRLVQRRRDRLVQGGSLRRGRGRRRSPRRSARVAARRPRRRGRARAARRRAPRAAPARSPAPARSARAPRGRPARRRRRRPRAARARARRASRRAARRRRRSSRARRRPSRPAANSSSTKNGLPPARACSSPASAAGTGRAGDRLELAGDVVAAERLEIEPGDERPARQLRDEAPRRVRGRELAGAVGERERDALGAQVAGEERDEVARRVVGPVHVLEHDQQRPAFRRAPEQLEHELVQPSLAEAVREARPAVLELEAGQQRGERAARVLVELAELVLQRQVAQRRDHGRVGELLAAELEALAVQRRGSPRSRARASSAPTQAGLADARLAGDQRELRSARRRVLERAIERAQRPVAADDRPARDLAAVLHMCE